MDEKFGAAPVSGEIEIMTTRVRRRAARGGGEIVDAEYETLDAAPRPAECAESAPLPQTSDTAAAGLEMLRLKGRQRQPRTPARGGPLFWTTGLALVAGAFWIAGGHAVVDGASFFAPSEPAEPLRIAFVQSRIVGGGERALLIVDGEAVNEGARPHRLPVISINVLDGDGRTTRFLLGTNGQFLEAGGRFPFSGRVTAPQVGVKSVSATFMESED